MAYKKVLLLYNRPPHGTIFADEGLRAALGVTSGIDEHREDIVFLGDGVYFTLKGVERATTSKYLASLDKQGTKPKAEKESLEARGINAADLAPDVEII